MKYSFVIFISCLSFISCSESNTVNQIIKQNNTMSYRAYDRTFRIASIKENNSIGGGGSGYIWADGWGITARHVVDNDNFSTESLRIIKHDGTTVTINSIHPSILGDIAFLEADLNVNSHIKAPHEAYYLGEPCEILGFPYFYESNRPLATFGRFSGSTDNFLHVVNVTSNPGNSGGPCINLRTGNLIGIITAIVPKDGKNTQDTLDYFRSNADELKKIDPLSKNYQAAEFTYQMIKTYLERTESGHSFVISNFLIETAIRVLRNSGIMVPYGDIKNVDALGRDIDFGRFRKDPIPG